MGYTKRSRNFCHNASRKINCDAKFWKMTAMKNDGKKIIMAKTVASSCAFPAQDYPETLPKWEPLGTFILCNDYAKAAFFSAMMSAGNMNKP